MHAYVLRGVQVLVNLLECVMVVVTIFNHQTGTGKILFILICVIYRDIYLKH